MKIALFILIAEVVLSVIFADALLSLKISITNFFKSLHETAPCVRPLFKADDNQFAAIVREIDGDWSTPKPKKLHIIVKDPKIASAFGVSVE